jgi:cardiolipin synthase
MNGTVAWPTWLALGLLVLVVLLALVIWSVRRHRNPLIRIDCEGGIDELLPSLAGMALGSVVPGNRVQVHHNGAFFDALVGAIGQARHSVHFETFLWKQGAVGQRLADALAERARAGVAVRLVLDGTGCRKIGKAVCRQLEDAGVRIAWFHRHRIYHIGVLNDRDHRKLCVVDGRVAFVGGHCIVDDWLGDGEPGRVADLSVQVEGPIVGHVQAVFSENWTGHTGEMFAGEGVFPVLEPAGDVPMHVAAVKPEGSAPAVKILHHAVLCMARRRLWIQNPYFIPEPEAVEAFGAAVARGVDVRVMMPSTGGSDNPLVQHAGHRLFERLLELGVKLYEYPDGLLHQKVMVVDSMWASVGSCNFDDRSFEINDEITLGMLDTRLARQLEAVFLRDLPRCTEIELERWRQRPWRHKVMDRLAYTINEVL